MVDPATLPDILPPASKRSGKVRDEEGEEERKIDLSEIIGLPDFDVCPLSFTLTHSSNLTLWPDPKRRVLGERGVG